MDLGILAAVVGSTVSIVAVMIALIFWARSESNSVRSEMKEDRKDFLQLVRGIENAINEMKIENKDFHYRLLEIEKTRK